MRLCLLIACATLASAQSPLEDGIADFRAGRLAQAEANFVAATAASPRAAAAWRFLGMTRAARGAFDLAAEPFRKACSLDARDPANCYYLGRNEYTLGRFEAALAAFDKVLAADARASRVHQGAGLALEALGRSAEAEARLRRAVKEHTQQSAGLDDPRIDLGAFLFRHARAAEALPLLEAAARDNPASSRAFFEMGHALAALDRNEDAARSLRKSVEIDPANFPAHLLLGKVCLRLGLSDEGRKHAEIGRRGVLEQSYGSRTVR